MAFQNLGFENAGPLPGDASGWGVNSLVTTNELAGFGSPERPTDNFEKGWNNDFYLTHLDAGIIEAASFGVSENRETFASSWTQLLDTL
ncbi:MAG: hypothetical protein A2Y38_16450 [Spirochaetes bacterium GWB1_59_5]|nr:MAG: hypothetical protein A2Y38_16450 [Spirochaetes bacterium GWB1_59_5]